MVEISFEASAHDDPFNTVTLDVVFTTPNNKTLRVPAFWAGGNQVESPLRIAARSARTTSSASAPMRMTKACTTSPAKCE